MAQRFVPKNYKVARNGVEIGEFEPFDFIEGVRSGEIRQDDWFWMEGMTDWKPVSDLKILEEFRKLPASPKPQKQRRGWFRRKPTQEKYVQAAFTVASNLYLHTIPGAENPLVPVPLKFNLPDSRFRYLMFCLSTAITAALVYDEKKEVQPEALINGCLHFATWVATEMAQEYFDDPANFQDSINSATALLQKFLSNWTRWPELEKERKSTEITDLICFMIHITESDDERATQTDAQRLGQLALNIQCRLPAMRDAFVELANR